MATVSLVHAWCGSSWRIGNTKNISQAQIEASSSSLLRCSSPSTSSSGLSFAFSNFPSVICANRGRRYQGIIAKAMDTTDTREGKSISKSTGNLDNDPDHLLILVHGIMASPSDWTYAEAELKRRLGKKFLIYGMMIDLQSSSCNTYSKTLVGIGEAGKQLADEVMQILGKTKSLRKISFLAHSLGGLFARSAIAVLYSSDTCNADQPNKNCMEDSQRASFSTGEMIAGLEPINFITLATPHLGVRGKRQLPFLFGVSILEKLAPPLAPLLFGQTGSQLFLTDGKPNKPPLLLSMASDCDDEKFISALGAFRCRVVYANVSYDHMVGWRTSSIRRETELCKPPNQSIDGYEHIVNVEYCPPVRSDGPGFSTEAAKAKEATQKAPNAQNAIEYYEKMEEEMIHGLQRLGWKKVDVNFHSSIWPFFAHYYIHVKDERLHSAGMGVIAHVADSIMQEETSYLARDVNFGN
ncbi:putative lipase YDR444W isoform X2 [Prosopis cineraria]|uniref:putative lipase YDR444W isoform X2 n=1 Tax=Prosopis cineraria TaxID=364024 RepID=UPI00240F908B|nr:putative lipase YDR444W isoform X2 [Prosopis cineraria]